MRQPDFKYPTVSLKQQSVLLDSWVSAAVMLSAKHSLVTMTYNEALNMALSDLTDIYESKSFKQLQKAQEAENQLKLAPIERLNEVIRGLNNVGKALSYR